MSPDRIILITGATDGLGRRVAEKLARPGTLLLLHGRNAARGKALVAAVEQAGASARFYQADFASLDGVRLLADAVQADHDRLDVLVNNAGIALLGGERRRSAEGFELTFAVNYLATFLLTHRLRPLLEAAQPSKVVNVASAGQSPIDFDDVMLERGYEGYKAYAQSKLAQILFTFDLAEELRMAKVAVNCLHPATYMDTTMVRNGGIRPINSIDTGADAVLALVNDATGMTGRYFDVQREAKANAQAYDREARRRLKALSLELTGLNG
jgi:NAD(P)-dependent dehydrogenase (short-subunit alcohol dehydrogenase family)